MTTGELRQKLKEAGIISTVIDDFSPSLSLHVTWRSSNKLARFGNALKPDDLTDEPSIELHEHPPGSPGASPGPNRTYVITLTDPDAPSRDDPRSSEYCHWIAAGTGSAPALTCLREVVPYKPPTPPEGTGPHRYVFVAFVPGDSDERTVDELRLSTPPARKHWGYAVEKGETRGVREWARENGLRPIGANFIYAQIKKQ